MNRNKDYLPFWGGKAEGKLKLLRLVIAIPAGILGALFMTFTMQLADMSPEEKNAAMERRAATLRSIAVEDSEGTNEENQRFFTFYRF